MRRPAPQSLKTAARRLLAVVLGLWLSGTGCLACCEGTPATHALGTGAAHRDAPARDLLAAIRAAERAAPPASASDGHSCCQARVGSRAKAQGAKEGAPQSARGAAADESGVTTSPAARRQTVPGRACCRRILQTAEQARWGRVEPAQQAHAFAPAAHAQTPPAAAARAQAHPHARARAPDRGGTYLVCRALLI